MAQQPTVYKPHLFFFPFLFFSFLPSDMRRQKTDSSSSAFLNPSVSCLVSLHCVQDRIARQTRNWFRELGHEGTCNCCGGSSGCVGVFCTRGRKKCEPQKRFRVKIIPRKGLFFFFELLKREGLLSVSIINLPAT